MNKWIFFKTLFFKYIFFIIFDSLPGGFFFVFEKFIKSSFHNMNKICPGRNRCYCGREFKKKKVNLYNKIQCTVCHEFIWPGRSRTIQCSFCGSQYHYSCVASWLTKHNSCPMCQNVFLKPNLIFSRNRK